MGVPNFKIIQFYFATFYGILENISPSLKGSPIIWSLGTAALDLSAKQQRNHVTGQQPPALPDTFRPFTNVFPFQRASPYLCRFWCCYISHFGCIKSPTESAEFSGFAGNGNNFWCGPDIRLHSSVESNDCIRGHFLIDFVGEFVGQFKWSFF